MTTAINRKHNSTFLDVSEPRGQCGLSGMRPESEQMRPESEPEALKPEISGGRYDQIHQISKGPLKTSVWVGGLAGARFSANLISYWRPPTMFWPKASDHLWAGRVLGETGPKAPDHLVKLKCWWQSMTRLKTQGSESFLPMDRPPAWRLCPRTLRWISHNCQTCKRKLLQDM